MESCTGRADGRVSGWLASVAAENSCGRIVSVGSPGTMRDGLAMLRRRSERKAVCPFPCRPRRAGLHSVSPSRSYFDPAVFQLLGRVHAMISDPAPADQSVRLLSFGWRCSLAACDGICGNGAPKVVLRVRWLSRVFLNCLFPTWHPDAGATCSMEGIERWRVRPQLHSDGLVRSHCSGPRAAKESCGGRR